MGSCPTPDEIRRAFLSRRRPSALRGVVRHVGSCEACRAVLERLTRKPARPHPSSSTPAWNGPPGTELPALHDLLYRLELIPGRVEIEGPETPRDAKDSNRGDGLGWVGDFKVVEVIGMGGMGVVLRAQDPAGSREVAIKVLSQRRDSPAGRTRFEREARAAASVRHPNVVPAESLGRLDDGRPYLVMPYLGRRTLRQRLETGPRLSPREAADLVRQVALGLQAVHDAGLVHRDVKPENILIADDGTPMLTDFSLVASCVGDESLTLSGDVLGTPAFMSPEQARGDAHRLDGRSDLYSLGVVLYRILADEMPFRGHDRRVIHQILHEDPRPLKTLNDEIPRDLETVCLKAMAREPWLRYARAVDLADDLRRVVEGRSIRARPFGPLVHGRRWLRAHPTRALAFGLVGSALMFALAFGAQRYQSLRLLAAEQGKTQEALRQARGLSSRMAFDRGLTHAQQGDLPRGLLWMARGLSLAPADDMGLRRALRANLGAWLSRLTTLEASFPAVPDPAELAVSPDGHLLATAASDGTVTFWSTRDGSPRGKTLKHAKAVNTVAFSPDGRLIATGDDDCVVRLWDASNGALLATPHTAESPLRVVAFRPDGRRLLCAGEDGVIRLIDVVARVALPITMRDSEAIESAVFSPDGRTILSGGFGHKLAFWDAESGKPVGTPIAHRTGVMRVAYHPTGRSLLSVGEDGGVRLWDAQTHALIAPPLMHQSRALDAAFSPDGRFVLTAGQDRATRLWDATTGVPLSAPVPYADPVNAVAFLPDGSFLTAARGGVVRRWRLPSRVATSPILQHPEGVQDVAYLPDGKTLLTACRDGLVRLWDARDGHFLRAFEGHTGVVYAVDVSPDGRLAASGSKDGTVRLWDVATGAPVGPPLAHGSPLYDVGFHPAGQLLMTVSGDGRARLWDLATRQAIGPERRHAGAIYHLAFSPDGRLALTSGEDGTARLWDVASGQPVGPPIVHSNAVQSVAFSADGSTFLTATEYGTLHSWNTATRRPSSAVIQLDGSIESVAVHPDGHGIVTGSRDDTVRYWDVATGRQIGPALTFEEAPSAVAICPDGKGIAIGCHDRTARLVPLPTSLDLDDSRLIDHVERVSGMRLNEEGILEFLPDPPRP